MSPKLAFELADGRLILRAGTWEFFWAQPLVSILDLHRQRSFSGHSTDSMSSPGGALANPASQYPIFRNVAFFQEYPYALPGFVSGAFCLSTAIVSFVCLDEVSLEPYSAAQQHLT